MLIVAVAKWCRATPNTVENYIMVASVSYLIGAVVTWWALS